MRWGEPFERIQNLLRRRKGHNETKTFMKSHLYDFSDFKIKCSIYPRLLIFGGTKGQIVPKKPSHDEDSPKKQTDSFILFEVKSSYVVKSNPLNSFSGRIYLDNILSNYSMIINVNSKGHGLYCSKQCALSSAVRYMGMMADVVEYY